MKTVRKQRGKKARRVRLGLAGRWVPRARKTTPCGLEPCVSESRFPGCWREAFKCGTARSACKQKAGLEWSLAKWAVTVRRAGCGNLAPAWSRLQALRVKGEKRSVAR